MHPAYSVIIFTTASGAGYGLLAWLALGSLAGAPESHDEMRAISLLLALALIAGGLVSSRFHLGRPERAWRALSQWQTSWLSREGVLALATFAPAFVLALEWIVDIDCGSMGDWAPWLAIAGALATMWCTGMIYASLGAIRAWANPLVAPLYIVLGLATGAVLATLLLAGAELPAQTGAAVALPAIVLGWIMKGAYWSAIDADKGGPTIETATGLGHRGKVRPLDPPHTQPNYVMREMGYRVARKHAATLRRMAMLQLFVLPALAMLAILAFGPAPWELPLTIVATASAAVGVLTERWLFFAEARHVASLYYGAEPVQQPD